LADEIVGFVPIIYTSQRNQGIAYNWKIKFNETGKIPAFYNVIPELNHNEMTGFDMKETTKYLADRFYILMLVDEQDHEQNKKRFEVLFQMYHERRLPVKTIILKGGTRLEKIFNSLLIADFTAFFIASHYGVESEQVPMVEEFKHRIAR
jgi:glucose/mannose-6-phosphate isomerase